MEISGAQAKGSAGRRIATTILGLLLVAAALVVYHGKLLFGGSLDALDWQRHVHYYELIHSALRDHGTIPLYLPPPYVTLTHSLAWLPESPILNPLVWLLRFMHAQAYLKTLFVLYATAGVYGAYLLARTLGAAPLVAALPAAIFGLQGFVLSHFVVGHHWVIGVYLWPFGVLCFLRATGGSRVAVLGLAALLSLLIVSGQSHPAIWLAAILGGWAALWSARERSWVPLAVYSLALLLTLGLAAVRIVPSAYGFGAYQPPERFPGIPASQLARALTTGGPTFQSGSGYFGVLVPFSWENDAAVGVLGAALLLAGLWFGRRSRESVLVLVAAFALAFAVDLGLAPWVVAGQRVPVRLLAMVVFCCLVVAMPGLAIADGWLLGGSARRKLRTPLLLGLGLLVIAERYGETRAWLEFGAGNPVTTRAWSPPLPRVIAGEATVSAVAVTPNRLTWDVSATRPSELLLPLRSSVRQLEWRVAGFPAQLRGQGVTVEVPAGQHRLQAEFVPIAFRAGATVSVLTAAGMVAYLAALRRRRRRMLHAGRPSSTALPA